MKYKLKVCGMKYADNIREVAALKPDYMGFIFYEKSKRFVGNELDQEVLASLVNIEKVGVFVNHPIDVVLAESEKYGFHTVQLHGDESPEYCKELGRRGSITTIKAFRVGEDFDFSKVEPFKGICTYFLFDTQTENYGGSGKRFNWQLLEKYDNKTPFFLSGGISPSDVGDINKLERLNIHAIDINSRFEIQPGRKDVHKIREFIQSLN
ncbi:MAG: phosphoribosylanthranilate isomerase [Cytophagaceae bacterium]